METWATLSSSQSEIGGGEVPGSTPPQMLVPTGPGQSRLAGPGQARQAVKIMQPNGSQIKTGTGVRQVSTFCFPLLPYKKLCLWGHKFVNFEFIVRPTDKHITVWLFRFSQYSQYWWVRVHTVFSFFILHWIKRKREIKLLHTVSGFSYYLIKIKKQKNISHTVFCFSYNQIRNSVRYKKKNTSFFISRYAQWKLVGYYLLPFTVLKTKNEGRCSRFRGDNFRTYCPPFETKLPYMLYRLDKHVSIKE